MLHSVDSLNDNSNCIDKMLSFVKFWKQEREIVHSDDIWNISEM